MRTALDTMRQELQEIKKTRLSLKDKIRSTQIKRDQEKLSDEAAMLSQRAETSIDPERKEKARRALEVLKQKMALNDLSLSTDVYRSKERNYRLELIRQMTGGAWPSQDWINKQLQKIEEANKTRISHSEYDRRQTEERAKQQGKIGPVAKRPGRVGGGKPGEKIHQYDIGAATFNGLVDKFSEKINTSAHVARLNVTQEVNAEKKKVHNQLKPLVDAVSKAIQKKDNRAKFEAIKMLKQKMVEWNNRAPAIKALSRNIKWLPFFNKMKTDLETIAAWKSDAGWDLNDNKKIFISNVIRGADRLTEAYERYYQGKGAPKGVVQLEISFDNTVKYLDIITAQLSKETGITGQDTQ
jgi:hypothetical protein